MFLFDDYCFYDFFPIFSSRHVFVYRFATVVNGSYKCRTNYNTAQLNYNFYHRTQCMYESIWIISRQQLCYLDFFIRLFRSFGLFSHSPAFYHQFL